MRKHMCMAVLASLLCLPALAGEWVFNGVKTSLVIDVRTPAEFAAGHVDGAINIPYEQIAGKIRAVPGASEDRPILLYCRSGRRSAIAREALEKIGYRRVLDGGGMAETVRNLKTCTAKIC